MKSMLRHQWMLIWRRVYTSTIWLIWKCTWKRQVQIIYYLKRITRGMKTLWTTHNLDVVTSSPRAGREDHARDQLTTSTYIVLDTRGRGGSERRRKLVTLLKLSFQILYIVGSFIYHYNKIYVVDRINPTPDEWNVIVNEDRTQQLLARNY